ncbi:MAG: ATP-binding protein [Candidatus Helarchaeota archaeon]
MKYLDRQLFNEITKWIDRPEIIAIKGPRQAGKTTLLEMLREWLLKVKGIEPDRIKYFTFEDRELMDNFSLAPTEFIQRYVSDTKNYFFLIDEIQYCKDVGQKLKLIYDLVKNVKLIVTGSSSLELTSQTAKFLVGRLFSFDLFTFSFYEFISAKDKNLAKIYCERNRSITNLIKSGENFKIPDKDIFLKELYQYLNEYTLFGGYPEVIKAKSLEEKRIILKNIFNTYLEKDIVSYLQISDTIKFKKLVTLLAASISNLITYERLTATCNSYYKEIMRLLNILQQTYIVELVRPFHKNLKTELRKNPKVFFYDLGLRNYAINNFTPLEIRMDAGALAENFIFNQFRMLADHLFINYWRTTAKTEVDFIIWNMQKVIPVEVKFRPFKKVTIPRSLHSFIENYNPPIALVVTKDFWGETWRKGTEVKFIPIVYF